MAKGSPRKSQFQDTNFKIWNYRGENDFTAFAPTKVLASDSWMSTADVSLDDGNLSLNNRDIVMALIDNPGAFTKAAITDGKWKIIRHISDENLSDIEELATTQQLRYVEELTVDTTPVTGNYNTTTKHLTIHTVLQTGDNVNLYLEGLKYSYIGDYNAFTYTTGVSNLVWIPINVGFDLEDGDYIEIEIYH